MSPGRGRSPGAPGSRRRRSPPPALLRAALAALAALGFATVAEPRGRLVLDGSPVPVDRPIWVCADGAPPPAVLHLDGAERPEPALGERPAGADVPRTVNLTLSWPERGPLSLLDAIDARPREGALPSWGGAGHLGPGTYVLTAVGFAPETLVVVRAGPDERRARAVLARAWHRASRRDSALAAALLEGLLRLEPGGPYADAASLALLELLPWSSYRDRPEEWLAAWVANHHSHCAAGAGIRHWVERAGGASALRSLARLAARYPQTRAAREARDWLRAGPGAR